MPITIYTYIYTYRHRVCDGALPHFTAQGGKLPTKGEKKTTKGKNKTLRGKIKPLRGKIKPIRGKKKPRELNGKQKNLKGVASFSNVGRCTCRLKFWKKTT